MLVDTNVILDVALRRPGLFDGSQRALVRCEAEGCELRIAWHTVANLFYILRKDRGGEKTVEFLRDLPAAFEVAPVAHTDALRALASGLRDLEDALQVSAAEACSADVILTRNKADFGTPAGISVLTPEEFSSR